MTATGPLRSAELALLSAIELILTSILLFGVTTIVRFVVGPAAISRAFPQIHVELLIVGVGVGALLTGLIKSPLGKISGGHANPAISFAMWRFGVFPVAGILPYAGPHATDGSRTDPNHAGLHSHYSARCISAI